MRIAILGTRGIPNSYGGFEQFAEYLSVGLVERGHDVTVYNANFHEYQEASYKGVLIRRIFSPEKYIGGAANFIYDFLCLQDALNGNFDILYELGYHSNAASYYFLGKNCPLLLTNMDGIEWKRSKWSLFTQKLIKRLERIAVAKSDYLVSDNRAIQSYYRENFGKDSFYIPYGAEILEVVNSALLAEFKVEEKQYFLLVARLEPENNIEMVLNGFGASGSDMKFLVVGNVNTKYGKFLQQKYQLNQNVEFIGSIYNKQKLDALRFFSALYFHGHSVGGTNPSLLEAMAAGALIASHDNLFNRGVVGEDALYFKSSKDIKSMIEKKIYEEPVCRKEFTENNKKKIAENYSWSRIVLEYERLFEYLIK